MAVLFGLAAFRVTGGVPRVASSRLRACPPVVFRATGFAVTHSLPRLSGLATSRARQSGQVLPRPARLLSYGEVVREPRRAVNAAPVRPTLRTESRRELYQLYKAAGLLHLFFALYPEP